MTFVQGTSVSIRVKMHQRKEASPVDGKTCTKDSIIFYTCSTCIYICTYVCVSVNTYDVCMYVYM